MRRRQVWVFENGRGYLQFLEEPVNDVNDRINSPIDTPLIRAKTNYAKAKYQHTTLERHEATPLRVEASRTIHPTNREEQ
jgi:hypothetical protein